MRTTIFLSRMVCGLLGVLLLVSCTSLTPTSAPTPLATNVPSSAMLTQQASAPLTAEAKKEAEKIVGALLTPVPGSPSGRGLFGMTYDSKSDQVILFGGVAGNGNDQSAYQDDTWVFDVASQTWREMKPPVSPSPRGGRLVYDAESDRSILYCSMNETAENGPVLKDTWAYDHNTDTWTQMKAQGPTNSWMCEMVYDSESDRIILFGGWDVQLKRGFQETWAYDYNSDTWTEMKPAVSPAGHGSHNFMVYDSKADRVILWSEDGSEMGNQKRYSKIWEYDYNSNTWVAKDSTSGPDLGWWPAKAFHEGAERFIVYGGDIQGSSNMWAYDYQANTWTMLLPSAFPGDLFNNEMVYIPSLDRLFMFGGGNTAGPYNHAWLYDYNANVWTEILPKP